MLRGGKKKFGVEVQEQDGWEGEGHWNEREQEL